MRKLILLLPAYLQSSFIILLTILIAFVISSSFRIFFDLDQLHANIDLITAGYEVLGTIYAILLTFTLWGVWQSFSVANDSVQAEAYALLDLVHVLEASATLDNNSIRTAALHYVEDVLKNEWPTLRCITAKSINLHAGNCSSLGMVHMIQAMEPANDREEVLFGHALTLLSNWLDSRRKRLLLARGNSARALWPLLITGALVLFCFHGLFVATTTGLWAVLLFGVALVIGITFYLIFTLDSPFVGFPSIDPEPFELALSILKTDRAKPI